MIMTDFEEYIKQGEPDKKEKSIIWQTAIGLQQVDGLKPSAYLIDKVDANDIEKLGVKLNENQLKMLEFIDVNNKITIIEMAKKLSISDTAIGNNIKKMREKGIITRIGSDKTGNWKIVKNREQEE